MNRLLLKTVVFVALFVPLHFAAASVYERTILERTPIRQSERQFEARLASGDRVRTLAVGDSHVRGAVDPAAIEDTQNVASTGENSVLSYYKLRSVLDAAPDVDVVILAADLHSFSSFRSDRFDKPALWARYVDWWEVGRAKGAPLHFLGLAAAARIPYLSGADDTAEVLWSKSDAIAADRRRVRNGFFGVAASFGGDRPARAGGRARAHFENHDVLEPVSVDYFRRSLALCRDRRVRVALVRFPVSEEYWTAAARFTSSERFYAEVASIAAPFENARIFDHHADFFGRPEFLRDSDHLNIRGAAVFSKALAAEVAALRSGSR